MTDELYVVVVNQEDQYSLWPAGRELPHGWERVGEPKAREECLAQIRGIWTDMRPRSLRVAMEAQRRKA